MVPVGLTLANVRGRITHQCRADKGQIYDLSSSIKTMVNCAENTNILSIFALVYLLHRSKTHALKSPAITLRFRPPRRDQGCLACLQI